MKVKEYTLGGQFLRYFIDDNNEISMYIVPVSKKDEIKNGWDYPKTKWATNVPYIREWWMGRLVHFHLTHTPQSTSVANSKKYANQSKLFLDEQVVEEGADFTLIKTFLTTSEGDKVTHYIKHQKGYDAVWTWADFTNMHEKVVELDLLSSFSFENLSPFSEIDSRGRLLLHRFLGGWSAEGRHICNTLESLGLEKAWQAHCQPHSERFGNRGGYSTMDNFPIAVIEDTEAKVFWTAQLHHNASWQFEVSRHTDCISFSGGLPDYDFGHWSKKIKPGETFASPKAVISSTDMDLDYACQSVVKVQEEARKAYGEKGLPITYNQYCTWERPRQDSFIEYAKSAAELGAKYVVIDAGWFVGGIDGQACPLDDWEIDKDKFPDMKKMNRELRSLGLIPGIWFEFECTTTKNTKMSAPEYDDMHLKKNGELCRSGSRTFWDMNNPKVKEFLKTTVIDMLKENEFGYIKVDYNSSVGIGCDGTDSLGEGLRRNAEGTALFFKRIKEEIPDIIIENCASGGNRNDPLMLSVSAVASFSDAHECIEIPIIAANLHNIILPAQSSVWAVLRKEDSIDRIIYSMCATLYGRPCLSGRLNELSREQKNTVKDFFKFYKKTEDIIINGTTHTYRAMTESMRYPKGTQLSVRYTDNELVVICHSFEDPKTEEIEAIIPDGFVIADEVNGGIININKNKVTLNPMKPFTATAVYAVKNK